MNDMKRLNAGIVAYQEAAMTPAEWGRALNLLANSLNSDGATLTVSRRSHSLCEGIRATPGSSKDNGDKHRLKDCAQISNSLAPFLTEYLRKPMSDPRYPRFATMSHERFLPDQAGFSRQEIAHNDYYQEFLKPRGFMWHAVAEVQKDVYITLWRELSRGPYETVALRELDAVLPSLRMASRIACLTWEANFSGRLSAFESVGRGALLLDRQGVVLAMNRAVTLGDGLDICHGRLTATSQAARKAFGIFLAELLNLNDDAIEPKSTIFALPRPSGARPIVVDGMTQSTALQSLHSAAVALLLLTDLEQIILPPTRLLSDLFELTRMEAQLAIQLCAGKSLRSAAEELLITEGYARQRLKAILQKTSTSRQAELMILLSKLSRSYEFPESKALHKSRSKGSPKWD